MGATEYTINAILYIPHIFFGKPLDALFIELSVQFLQDLPCSSFSMFSYQLEFAFQLLVADIIPVSQKIQGNRLNSFILRILEGHIQFYPGNVGYAILSG